MASFQKHISKDGTVTFRVQLFINGVRDSKGGFTSKPEAKLWAATREVELLSGTSQDHSTKSSRPKVVAKAKHSVVVVTPSPDIPIPATVVITSKTLGDVFDRYVAEVSPKKIGYRWEKIRLYKLSGSPLAKTLLTNLGPVHIAQWRDDRLKQVSSATTRREMTLISSALEAARREWRWITTNPSRDVRKPADSK